MTQGVTPEELAEVMRDRGKRIASCTIRYHCRDPRGMLYRTASRVGRSWYIPARVADEFARTWEPYESMRRK